MTAPVFAIVGHPNKGKSSLVSTLARDASVRVGPEPGTTVHAREFPMRVGGRVLYTLVDTPGFQRARAVRAWLQQSAPPAAGRAAAVSEFVRVHSADERFRNECELLRPLVEGAGLIYVVDGATPYGPEYDAEMEILRWTGQPSLAVINPIGEPRFVEPWQRALEQYFRVVRVLDVLKAPFDQQLELLRAFGQLREAWRAPLATAVDALIAQRERQQADAARVIAELISTALAHAETVDLPAGGDPSGAAAARLARRYEARLRSLEEHARRDVEACYGFDALDRTEISLALLDTDLLSKESWLVFGLKKRDLVVVSATGGALAGGVVDTALLGASFLTGSIVGGVVGGALGYFSSSKLADVKLLRQPLGGVRLRYGPSRNVQFPFVLLHRAWLHHALIAGRTHAQRGTLAVDTPAAVSGALSGHRSREFARRFEAVRRHAVGSEAHATAVLELTREVQTLLAATDRPETPRPTPD